MIQAGASRPRGEGYTSPMPMPMAASRALVLALALPALLTSCSVISIDLQPRIRPLVEETVEGSGSAKILLMDLSGILSDESVTFTLGTPPPRVPLLARVREELRKAERDDQIRALVLRINSPGGTVTASDILYREVMEFRARTKVPVVASIMDVGASGGYYVALAADRIVAHPTTVTGSIGVIMVAVNAQGLLDKIGVVPQPIKSGPRKDAGSPFRPLTDDERAIFQSVIDDLHGRFVRVIVESRRLPEDRVRAAADGRIYTAEQALALGLVDRVGYLPEAVDTARQAARLEEARVVMYHRPREYRSNFYSGALAAPSIESSLAQLSGVLAGTGPRFLYLWWP
jgi:protease-4